MELTKKLAAIQQSLNAPKGQRNNFGNYNYRSCEDILTAVKPLLGDLILTITDEPILVGDRFYIQAKATITDGKSTVQVTGYAREQLAKKGMDEAQITGAASSYARKYALNGLFCIDDTKDADTNEYAGKRPKGNFRAGANPEFLPKGLKEIYGEIRYAVDNEDWPVVAELFDTFDIVEEKKKVGECFSSSERSAMAKYRKSPEFKEPNSTRVTYIK
jgi:hypothetical protein